jgi:hypothetical protein
MQTVTLQCGGCRKLMAVGVEYLGQQVRCPHCQQVVLVPAPAAVATTPAAPPPPAPEPAARPPAPDLEGSADIFSEGDEDDVLGSGSVPALQIPPPPPESLPPLNGALAEAAAEMPPAEAPAPPPPQDVPPPVVGESALPSWMTDAPSDEQAAPAPWPQPQTAAADTPGASATEPLTSPAAPPADQDLAPAVPARKPAGRGGWWFIPLVFVPLVFYAVLGTALFLWYALIAVPRLQHQGTTNPFDQLPDDGDDRGVIKDGKRISYHYDYPPGFATLPLPAAQRVALNNTIRIGAIEVTPTRVERKRIHFLTLGRQPTECRGDSLVLHLQFRNVSPDERFAPLDNYFDRWWDRARGMPLTQLEAGKDRFCGGPAHWAPPQGGKELPEWVEGRQRVDTVGLKPGEQGEGIVCTDGNDRQAVRVLFGEDDEGHRVARPHPGPFLWRVQVRRGLIRWRDRERSATTVIGVEFGRDAFAS